MTGFREGEVMHVTRPDIDFGNHMVRVKAKPKLGFIPKDWEEREVPIPDRLWNSLRDHKASASANHALVFASSNGKVVHDFLRQCKSVAWRAGLNCGLCDTAQGHCARGPHCQNWFLHKFRATFATMHLRAGVDLTTVQTRMGHKDLESTMRYLKPARDREALRKVNVTFPLPRAAVSESGEARASDCTEWSALAPEEVVGEIASAEHITAHAGEAQLRNELTSQRDIEHSPMLWASSDRVQPAQESPRILEFLHAPPRQNETWLFPASNGGSGAP
jgi:hypothetical protein